MRQSIVTVIALAVGGAVSAWAVPAQWDLILALGFVAGFISCASGTTSGRGSFTGGASDEASASGVNAVRTVGMVLAVLAGLAFWLISYADVARWADPRLLSFAYFAGAALGGLAVCMLLMARKIALSGGWTPGKEATG